MTVSKERNFKGPFIHRPGDDDSAAVTFWGKQDLRDVLRKALALLDQHYEKNADSRSTAPTRRPQWEEMYKLKEKP